MSSEEDNQLGPQAGSKKRRTQRACDKCRHKKVRCDGAQMPGGICSNCIVFSLECTRTDPPKRRGPKGHVELLEQKLSRLEALMAELHPDMDLTKVLDIPSTERTSSTSMSPSSQPDASESEDDTQYVQLMQDLEHLAVTNSQARYFGSSSCLSFLQTVKRLKSVYSEEQGIREPQEKKRLLFWQHQQWEFGMREPINGPPCYIFPPADLLIDLVELYFSRINPFIPLLHRPSFERQIAELRHLRDNLFGSLVLLVCAVASRYSSDSRVFLDGTNVEQSCGWRYFSQVHLIQKTLLPSPPDLHELQYYCLAFLYLFGASITNGCWHLVGIGIRIAVDRGVHRRKPPDYLWTAEDELWKRAFWVLISFDRTLASLLGRPLTMNDTDFDAELLFECDDEYWPGEPLIESTPELAFRQPATKGPSMTTYFNLHLKLREIDGFLQRSFHSINKSKIADKSRDEKWRENAMRKLQDALHFWLNSVPHHLRWNASQDNHIFFEQAAALHILYQHLQLQTHLIPLFGPKPPLNSVLTASELINMGHCVNAACTSINVADTLGRRSVLFLPDIQISMYIAAIALLMKVFATRRTGLTVDIDPEIVHVQKSLDVLRVYEHRWYLAGRFVDSIANLATMDETVSPKHNTTNLKRDRNKGLSGQEQKEEQSKNEQQIRPTVNLPRSRKLAQSSSTHTRRPTSYDTTFIPFVAPEPEAYTPLATSYGSMSFDDIIYGQIMSSFSDSYNDMQTQTHPPYPIPHDSGWPDTSDFGSHDLNHVAPNIARPGHNYA